LELLLLNSLFKKYWTILDVSFGGQLLGSLIVRTVNNSFPEASANDTRFFVPDEEFVERDKLDMVGELRALLCSSEEQVVDEQNGELNGDDVA